MLKLTQVGNSVGVILPKELLARLRVEKGDAMYVTETAEGILALVTAHPPLGHRFPARGADGCR